MADLFKEIIPSILQTKKYVLNDESDIKDYNPFLVNRALSYHMDTILYANEMNKKHGLHKTAQYQYLINSVRGMKRKFHPWNKQLVVDDLECVKEYYGYSNNKAKDALRILSKEHLAEIKNKINKGGVIRS
jgi:hypothetical protein